ncbi:MAG: rod shape-determining protein RodA [Treponema sp.]|jgi:rod shape determining protein RodA|nr:rod shape-determining protein RodA [Treponema sp.]
MKLNDILKIDYLLLLPVMVLLIIGILFIYSSGITSDGVQVSNEYIRQIIWSAIGLIIALVIALTNYRLFYNLSVYIYLVSLLPLIYTLLFVRITHAARWLRIGSFGIQASEFVKISVIILLARFLADTDRNKDAFQRFMVSCIIVMIPMLIVVIQPDLGTALVFIAILMIMTFMAGVAMRYVAFMILSIAFTGIFLVLPLWQSYIQKKSIPLLALLTNPKIIFLVLLFLMVIAAIALFGYIKFKRKYFYWIVYASAIIVFSLGVSFAGRIVLKEYQIMRLIVFIDPNIDPRGAGWNIIQSVTAIGAGGFMGRGYLQGTQSHYRFLPEQSTDFIFSIFSEEAGFLGGLVVFLLFLLIITRLLATMKITTDPFAKYVCAGLAGMYGFHFMINVGMTMGIMPITGIPLIFVSYGGSAVFSGMIGIGLVLSIFIRRYNR